MSSLKGFVWFLVLAAQAKADMFIQYSFGASQDFNSQSTQTIHRSYFNELSFYFQPAKVQGLFFGLSYSLASSYQTESDNSSTTQSGNSPLLALRYYVNKSQTLGVTIQFSPMSQLYYSTETAETNWTGSAIVVKPGLYPHFSDRWVVAIELSYYMFNYTKKSVLSGTVNESSFTRTNAIPSAGIIWNF